MSSPRASLPADERPFDYTPVTTADLPATPTRDRNIAATAWGDAPNVLLDLGAPFDIPADRVAYKRRLGAWLLWRAGSSRGPAIYLAIDADDLSRSCHCAIEADGTHHGVGPTGVRHDRFRAWKEDLLGR